MTDSTCEVNLFGSAGSSSFRRHLLAKIEVRKLIWCSRKSFALTLADKRSFVYWLKR